MTTIRLYGDSHHHHIRAATKTDRLLLLSDGILSNFMGADVLSHVCHHKTVWCHTKKVTLSELSLRELKAPNKAIERKWTCRFFFPHAKVFYHVRDGTDGWTDESILVYWESTVLRRRAESIMIREVVGVAALRARGVASVALLFIDFLLGLL